MVAVHVRAAGPGTSVQDLGRSGLAHWGVARSGAADRASLRRANRLVGNAEGLAALECLMGGVVLGVDGPTVVAITGARCPVLVDGARHGQDVALALPGGARLEVGPAVAGLRAYVAVRGGLAVPAVLGARAHDTLSRLGTPPVSAGDTLPVGACEPVGRAWFEVVAAPPLPRPAVVRVVIGPREDWITAEAMGTLFATAWEVGAHSDRVGLRLRGPVLERREGDLASEPTMTGAVQVPPDGQPIILGPDSGTTGGYPVAAVVVEEDLDVLGQLRPGDALRLRRHRRS